MLKLGVIGFGIRIRSIVKEIVDSGKAELIAIADINPQNAKNNVLETLGDIKANYYTDAEKMLINEKLDGVCIGTRCDSHTEYALLCARYNIPMFLEKPICTNESDLMRLKGIISMNEKTVVSFPLRMSFLLKKVKEIVDSGKIGKIEHIQAYNNVPYGRGYYHKWYRNDSITGGLWLQKATHDFDYINYLLGENKPLRICAVNSKQIFKGNEPAGKKCADCEKAEVCTESPRNVSKFGDGYSIGEYCCFAKDTGNEDSGSAIIEYESGMHVVYSQNFIVRGDAGKRGARLIGYEGTLEFDWIKNTITVYKHLEPVREDYSFRDIAGNHFGGDSELVINFINVMNKSDISHSTLDEGILSAEMCLAAKKSSTEHVFIDL